MKRLIVICTFLLMSFAFAHAQHTVGFSLQSTACKTETLAFDNTSDTGGTVEWNFCANELTGTYESSSYGNLTGFLTSIEIVQDNGTWFGFATSRNNELLRLDFGSFVLNSEYTITSLGNPSNLLNSPDGISIVKDGGTWYGLVTNISSGEIIRLKWTSLSATPEATSLGLAATGKFNQPSQIEIQKDNGEFIALVANGGSNKLVAINFHNTMATNPAAADVTESIAFTGASGMYGVSATRQCDTWEIYTIAADKIYRVTTPSLTSTITAGQIQDFSSSFSFPIGQFNRIRSIKYYDRTFIFFTSFTGGYLAGASWQTGASAPQVVNTGSVAMPSQPYSLALFKDGNSYGLYAGGFNAGAIRAIKISSECSASKRSGTEFHPIDVSYSTAGSYTVGLNITYPDGQVCSASNDVTVSSLDATAFDFSFDNICKNSTTSFTISATENMPSSWDYGDGTADNSASHSYVTAGTYEVVAVVTSANSCTNRRYKDITIYEPPVASFDVPSGQLCTNNVFTFVDTTPDNFDGHLTYQWEVDNVTSGTDRNLEFAFPSASDHTVKLTTTIPGCSSNVSHNVTGLLPGATVGFTMNGSCATRDITFTNSSSGDITGVAWDFGDSQASTATSPTHVFAAIGNYPVKLSATTSNGCVSTTTQNLTIYSTPQTALSLDLPPFSCSGSPSQFHDTTPSMTDSNIQSWNWSFGDTGSGTGKNPVHTYANAGPYTVRLSVTTDRGCTNFVDQQVNIEQSPVATFIYGPACVNRATQFNDISSGNIASWQWKIGSALYNTNSPQHTFAAAGNYSVQLVITGGNNCTASLTKQVTVPPVPTVDFQMSTLCSNKEIVFTDITSSPTDPIVQQNWSFAGLAKATGQQASFAFLDAAPRSISLSVKSQSGCTYSTQKNVNILQSPTASFTMSDQSGPPPLHIVFTNTSTAANSYIWTLGDGSSESTNGPLEHTYTSLGDYNVSLKAISTNGCEAATSKVVSVITPVIELALEDFLLKQSGGASSYQGYVQVRNNGNYRITSFVVNYEVGGGIVLSETVPSNIQVGEMKTYTLATTFNQPVESAFVCAELNDDTNDNNNKACATLSGDAIILGVSPNPADSYIDIESIHATSDQIRVRLYNTSGGVAYDRSFDVDKGLSRLSPDLQNLSPGIYVVVITSGGTSTSQRLLIIR